MPKWDNPPLAILNTQVNLVLQPFFYNNLIYMKYCLCIGCKITISYGTEH